jgi:hypothetical protein
MTSKTRNLIREIQTKLKSPNTGQREFSKDEAVVAYAVQKLYDDLKKKRLL